MICGMGESLMWCCGWKLQSRYLYILTWLSGRWCCPSICYWVRLCPELGKHAKNWTSHRGPWESSGPVSYPLNWESLEDHSPGNENSVTICKGLYREQGLAKLPFILAEGKASGGWSMELHKSVVERSRGFNGSWPLVQHTMVMPASALLPILWSGWDVFLTELL